MGRFFLHMKDFKGGLLMDEEGAELPSLASAREKALLAMQEFLADAVRRGSEPPFEAIVVADQSGTQLAAVPLIAALPFSVLELFKQPDKLVPPEKLEEYRRQADDCRGKAEATGDLDDKMSWLKLADAWLQMLPRTHLRSDDLAGWPETSDQDSKASH